MVHTPVRLGILGTSLLRRPGLRQNLEVQGLAVVVEETLSSFLSDFEHQNELDVLLLDLEQAEDDDLDVLEALLEHSPVPMVFYDGTGKADSRAWWGKFARKIVEAASARPPRAAQPVAAPPPKPPATEVLRQRVWVLGASFGGPEALKRFLKALPAAPDIAMIIGQHIGEGFVEVLAAQLNRVTSLRVLPAAEGAPLQSGHVYVAPVQQRIAVDAQGCLRMREEPERLTYRPSINALMEEVAARFGPHSGAIVFTGMGDDGARGCRAIVEAGGVVWAQDSASCAIDSMPSCARATGLVSRSGSPELLAQALCAHLETASPPRASAR
jgi:chemosensory pili system protein ChpB (putative protein-glutamate methylesterase)